MDSTVSKMWPSACYLLTSRAVVFVNDFFHGLICSTFLSPQHNSVIKNKDAHRGETGLTLFWYNGRAACRKHGCAPNKLKGFGTEEGKGCIGDC